MKQDPPSFESTMSVDETDPIGSSSLKSGSPPGEVAKTIDPESMSQVDAAVAGSKSLMEDDDDGDDDVSVKSGASEQRDQPQMGGFSCQPYNSQEWEALYNTTLCNTQLGEQLEMMTHCRNPMDLLSAFNPPTSSSDRARAEQHTLPVGAYAIPRTCEYCGSETTDHCAQDCQRPKSFFRKKRPPFSPKSSVWESETDYEIVRPKKTQQDEVTETHPQRRQSPLGLQWMTGIFTKGG